MTDGDDFEGSIVHRIGRHILRLPGDTKYSALARHFRNSRSVRLHMTFDEVASFVPGGLPSSAFRHQAWWRSTSPTHVQAKAWADYDWRVAELDLAEQTVTFVRDEARRFGPGARN